MRVIFLTVIFSIFFVSPVFAAKIVFYLNFNENIYHHNEEHNYEKEGFEIKTFGIGNKAISLNKVFSPEETQKQFFVGIVDVPPGVYSSVNLNGKTFTLPSSISLKKYSVKAVFIKVSDKGVQVFSQNLLSVSRKQFFSLPLLKALGVIDEDTGLISGFIGFSSSPFGISLIDSHLYAGLGNGQIVDIDIGKGFLYGAVSATSVSLKNKFFHSILKIYVPEKYKSSVFYFCPETGARFIVPLSGRISDAYYSEATGSLVVGTVSPDRAYILSGGSGKVVDSISFPGEVTSVTADEKALYVADKDGKVIYRYNYISKSIEVFPVYSKPLLIRNFGGFIFLSSLDNLLVLNKGSISPYVIFNIRDVREISGSKDGKKIFVFTGDKKYYVINLDSLYVELAGNLPENVFQAN